MASCSGRQPESCSASQTSRSRRWWVSSAHMGCSASAKGLQDGDAVPVIAITGTGANVAGIVGGIIVFGDPLSGNPTMVVAEMLAFALVLVAAWLTPAPVRARRATALTA